VNAQPRKPVPTAAASMSTSTAPMKNARKLTPPPPKEPGVQYWQEVARLSLTLSDAQLVRARSLAMWLWALREKLIKARTIVIDVDRMTFFFSELLARPFNEEHHAAAEMWIVRGNWQYKSPKTLTLDDFWPTAEHLERHCGEQVVTLKHHQATLLRVTQEARRQGYSEGCDAVRSQLDTPPEGLDAERWLEERREQNMRLLDAVSAKADLIEDNRRMKHELERYNRKVERLEAELDAFRSGAAAAPLTKAAGDGGVR
jgi:hypothetical protein